ncbi:GLI pathogenesis-related 2 isoform X2 [Narcine bancroftii]|uniref:GLI pathogenesis-related 2 isoform X2 n=1 Tax=Narcine bancroftii TaxID=1343680 RepID=UPI003831DEBB
MAHINPTGPGNFASQLLKSVNEYRRRHGTKPLILNPVISEKAEKWAKHLISSRTLQHSDTVYGENIWCQQGPLSLQVTGQQVADSWYNEIKNYDFSSSGFQKNCGHFTQLVWRDSKELGVGLASDGKGLTVVVAQFDPAGNITNPGYFARNVLPVGSKVVEAGGSAHRENTSKCDLLVTSKQVPVSGEDSGNFAIQLLNSANKCRVSHGVPPLTLSSQISKNAEKWAKNLVTSRTLQHSDTTYGENIWCQQGSQQVTGQQVVDSWYNEIKDYDFSSPGFQKTCGHFTQLVWRDSKELGVGLASDGKGLMVVVAQFDPAGNITNPGYFAKNVLPIGSKVMDEKRSADIKNTRTPDAPIRTGDTSGDFPKQLLKFVNEHRRSHGVQPLTMNPSISKNAKKWAEHLVTSRTLQHSDTQHGENIWYQQGPVSLQVTGQEVADSWYNEIKNYDFSSPGFQKNCGHFTQLVWRDSKELGVGLASDGKGLMVVVAQFDPAGNITNPGYFARNVLPVGSKVQKDEVETFHREKVKTSEYPDTRNVASASDNEKGAFIVELLKEHNRLRAQHQSPSLQVNSELSEQAQKWAEHLVNIKTLQHSSTKYGENLWYKWSSNKVFPTGTEVSQAWYKEIEEYNFDAPGFHSGTGHFTQLVWKASREIGVGIATDGKGKFIVVAVYNPAGNISNPGYFKDNVLPARKP